MQNIFICIQKNVIFWSFSGICTDFIFFCIKNIFICPKKQINMHYSKPLWFLGFRIFVFVAKFICFFSYIYDNWCFFFVYIIFKYDVFAYFFAFFLNRFYDFLKILFFKKNKFGCSS